MPPMNAPIDRCTDASSHPPRLRRDINLGTLAELPPASRGWRPTLAEQLALLKADGHEAAQVWQPSAEAARAVLDAGLAVTGICRALLPAEVDAIVRAQREVGCQITTLHVGNSFETDAEMDALAAAVLEASARHGHPIYVETHRGTMTQDLRRTLDLVARFPELRFNADLSHWYTGHELTYGGEFYERAARLQPVFERVRFLHARVGNPGCIQTGLDDPGDYLTHFRWMWQRCFEGFLRGAGPGDYLSFNAELLPQKMGADFWLHYAQPRSDLAGDALHGEPSDRYNDAERLWRMASDCFDAARAAVTGAP
jgi:hypothetical protein|mmetsp:Transcript_5366/g.20387  ORF Transcript_5366/g.20387 Transcript_5366/m.20387 type:complete len:312 (+) Transcript_5366:408-1343(+)